MGTVGAVIMRSKQCRAYSPAGRWLAWLRNLVPFDPGWLPLAPLGYSWVRVPEMGGAVLAPANWYARIESQSGTLGVFITKEDIAHTGYYRTGWSLQIARHAAISAGKDPQDFVHEVLQGMMNGRTVVREPRKAESDSIVRYEVMFRNHGVRGDFISLHRLLVSLETGTMFCTTIESPSPEWNLTAHILDPVDAYAKIDLAL